jgi:hypothetical protein
MTTQMTNLIQEITGRAIIVAILAAVVIIFLCLAGSAAGGL